MSKVGVKNPLFLLDEIDKMSSDMRGDPSSALLEVLDPEQNNAFNDHYLEVDYDLSDVMFVATSNSMDIPGPLLDRMEVIRLSGYTEDEKLNIAKRHLVDKQVKRNGLKANEITIEDSAIIGIILRVARVSGISARTSRGRRFLTFSFHKFPPPLLCDLVAAHRESPGAAVWCGRPPAYV